MSQKKTLKWIFFCQQLIQYYHNLFHGLKVSWCCWFLTPTTLLKLNDSDIIKSSYDFVLNYEIDITSDLAHRLIALKTVIINSEIKTIKNLAQFFVSNGLPSSFPDILSIIFMCIVHISDSVICVFITKSICYIVLFYLVSIVFS